MLVISEDFEKSVSAIEREMKGYVEVLYTSAGDKDSAILTNSPDPLLIDGYSIDTSTVLDNDRKGKNYAALEKDYFKLDGTFVLPNNARDKNPGSGFISKEIFSDSDVSYVPFNILTGWGNYGKKSNGITMYFQNNVPIEIEITVNSLVNGSIVSEVFDTDDVNIKDNGIVSLVFSEREVTQIYILVTDVLYPDRRVRLQEVDFGLSSLYEDDDLISFKTTEQIDIFSESMPVNEIDVVLGDFDSKFDPNNPDGITQYLGDNVLIKPYIGVVTEDNGIEYCSKGTYWFDSYDSNSKEATLKGKDIFGKLQDKDFNKYYEVIDDRKMQPDASVSDYIDFKEEHYGITITDEHLPAYEINQTVSDMHSKIDTKAKTLQRFGIVAGGTFNSDRDGNVVYKSLYNENSTNTTDKLITFDNMKEYPKKIAKDAIKTISVSETIAKDNSVSEATVFYKNQFTSYDTVELYIDVGEWKDMMFPDTENCTVLTSSWSVDPTAPEGEQGNYGMITDNYAYLKLRCNGNVSVQISGYSNEVSTTDNIRNVNDVGQEIKIDDDFIASNGTTDIRSASNRVIDFYLQHRNNYKTSFTYNGDPTLECGDVISIENKYDDENVDKVIITKIESEYKGSYIETIEGDILEQ